MRKRRLHLDPYTGDPVEDARYHGIPVENHRRLSGGKRRRSSSPLRKEPRNVTRVGTYLLSVNGARFAIVRRIDRVDPDWQPLPKPAITPVTLRNRNRGHAAGIVRFDDSAAPSPTCDTKAADQIGSTCDRQYDTTERNETPLHSGLAAFRARQAEYKRRKANPQ